MINATVYEEVIHSIWEKGAIAIVNNKPTLCTKEICGKCELSLMNGNCEYNLTKWLMADYIPQKTDWNKVPVDAKIRVKIHDVWYNEHFAKYDHNLHLVCFWHNGKTSFTSNQYSYDYVEQAYAELLEVEELPNA